jgi:hypothetical protein
MPSGEGRSGRTIPGAIKTLFRAAVKAVALPGNDAPKPEARKRRGGTDSRAPLCVTPRLDRQGGKPSARGRYAVLSAGKAGAGKIARRFARAANDATHTVQEEAVLYLADTQDWLNLWQDNRSVDDNIDDNFLPPQSYPSPQL